VELDRQLLDRLVVRVGYQQRNTGRDFVITPKTEADNSLLELSNGGSTVTVNSRSPVVIS